MVFLVAACGGGSGTGTTLTATTIPPDLNAGMAVSSKAFEDQGEIPARFSCDGENVSPELAISGIPEEARSLAIIMDDPDAPGQTFVHWVEYDIPVAGTLPEAATAIGVEGVSSAGRPGYYGPCPPGGPAHRYFFTVYALDASLGLPAGADKGALLSAMEGHILAEAVLMGTYGR